MPYPTHIRSTAQNWVAELYTELDWQVDQSRHFKPGEAGGYLVNAAGFEYSGYMKPTKKSPDSHPRAANEKIVSDLAAYLDLSVPPVLLYERPNCPQNEEPFACVSLVMYPEQWEWGQIQGQGGAALDVIASVLARSSGIIALDAFVGNTDRNNSRNGIFGKNPNSKADDSFLFLDFANSLNHNNKWEGGSWNNVAFPPLFPPLAAAADWRVIDKSLNSIEAMSEEVIVNIVSRIPDTFMKPDHRQTVTEGLMHRRGLVRPILQAQFAPQRR